MMRGLCCFAAAVLALTATAAFAANTVKITADTFVVNETETEAVFTGNVVVVRTGLTVWADRIVVDYAEGGPESIKSFVATGHVRLKTEDQDATGERATFNPQTQILRLTGNVTVINASGTLNGPELEIDLARNTTVFSGGKAGRVTGVFTTQ
ncbi:MAG: LptA/OstA family protein [Devosia sp.]|nr:LptA/OstA family protein [Devosia sp.]